MKAILLTFAVIAACVITLEAAAADPPTCTTRPEPAPFQTVGCSGGGCALPEPEHVHSGHVGHSP